MTHWIEAKLLLDSQNRPDLEAIGFDPAIFFEGLNLKTLFQGFPLFDEKHRLFPLVEFMIASDQKDELSIRFFDELFVECLTGVKEHIKLDPAFLLKEMEKQRSSLPYPRCWDVYEKVLRENPYPLIHSLTLHLAWDRVCIYMASLFDRDLPGLKVFKECLVESFEHISLQGKTVPSFPRFLEALYSYYLQKQQIESHTDEEWQILSKGALFLQGRDSLISKPYISVETKEKVHAKRVWTLDSPSQVEANLSFASCILTKLQKEHSNWSHVLCPVEVFCMLDGTATKYSYGC